MSASVSSIQFRGQETGGGGQGDVRWVEHENSSNRAASDSELRKASRGFKVSEYAL